MGRHQGRPKKAMGDLYLHLGFARRARFADGLHPIAVEALVRAPGAVILGATLPSLPEVEHKGASFFRRLFMPGKQKRAFWTKALAPAGSPSLELALALMPKGKGARPGGMARFALGLGVLSHQVLHAHVGELTATLEGSARDAMERALARMWLAEALPNNDVLAAELKPTLALEENASLYRPLIEHLNGALREAHGDAPGAETLSRWLRGLCAEVEPLVERGAPPPSLGVSDVDARQKHGEALFAAVEDARRWFVFVANQLAPLFTGAEPSREEMRRALVDENDALRRPTSDEAPSAEGFHDALAALRREHLSRGRNEKPAYDETPGAPGAMPPLPDDASGPMLPVPAHTQEVSVADIEAELATPPAFAAPAHTQEVSVAQIEEQLSGASAPGQSPAVAPPPAPKSTQQVSLDQIETELAAQGAPPPAVPPPAPTSTQQVSLDDIQEELATAQAAPPSVPPPAPTSTQQVSLDDIQEELATAQAAPSSVPPPAPTSTQQVSLDDIQEELANVTVPPPQAPGAPFLAGAVPVPPPPSLSPAAATPAPSPSAEAPSAAGPSAESAEQGAQAPTAASVSSAEGGEEQANGAAPTGSDGDGEGAPKAAEGADEKVRADTDPAGA